jgi:hypothetical protein
MAAFAPSTGKMYWLYHLTSETQCSRPVRRPV